MILLVILGLLVAAIGGFILKRRISAYRAERAAEEERAEQRRKDAERKRREEAAAGVPLSIYFGSQTGTAEGFAKDIANLVKKKGFKPSVKDLEDFDPYLFPEEETLAIFVTATYGEGDPPDNAIEFHKFVNGEENVVDLSKLYYTVFGLGNKQYEHYNKMARDVDTGLERFGAHRVYALGEGDDDGTLEDDFDAWVEDLVDALRSHAYPGEASIGPTSGNNEDGDVAESLAPTYKYCEVFVAKPQDQDLVRTEGRFDARVGKVPRGKIGLSSKHYFETVPCKVVVNKELRQSAGEDGLGSTLHVEFDLKETGLKYSTADTFAIAPENDPKQVEALANWLGWDLDQWFTLDVLENEDDDEVLGPLIPTPCTVRTALTCYCGLNNTPTRSLLGRLAHTATRPEHRKRLAFLSSKEGKDEFHKWAIDRKISVLDVFESFPSLRPTISQLLENLPRLQPRDYTISSSDKVHPNRIHTTVSVVKEPLPGRNQAEPPLFHGVCSNFLTRLQPFRHEPRTRRPAEEKGTAAIWPQVYAFVRKSTFILPRDPAVPIILVGPGTGIAPMRACIQERRWQREQGMNPGETMLFFGCKRQDEDFIYKDEILDYCNTGDITTFEAAFSREQTEKVYVQHRLQACGDQVWDKIHNSGGYVFVCGGTVMGKDVHAALVDIAMEHGKLSEEDALSQIEAMSKDGRYVQELWS